MLVDKFHFESYILIILSILCGSYFISYYLLLSAVKEELVTEYTSKMLGFLKRQHEL